MLNELSNDPIQRAIARLEKQHEEDKQVSTFYVFLICSGIIPARCTYYARIAYRRLRWKNRGWNMNGNSSNCVTYYLPLRRMRLMYRTIL